MYHVKTDEKVNHLYITIGQIQEDEAEEIKNKVLAEIPKLKKGFVCILDVSKYMPLEKNVTSYVEECQKALINAGLSREIRVVGDVTIPQRKILGKAPSKKVYEINIVTDIAEAAEFLAR